jgi:hypothetical protein
LGDLNQREKLVKDLTKDMLTPVPLTTSHRGRRKRWEGRPELRAKGFSRRFDRRPVTTGTKEKTCY